MRRSGELVAIAAVTISLSLAACGSGGDDGGNPAPLPTAVAPAAGTIGDGRRRVGEMTATLAAVLQKRAAPDGEPLTDRISALADPDVAVFATARFRVAGIS